MKKIISQIFDLPIFSAGFRCMFFLCALGGFLLPKFWLSFYFNNLDYAGFFKNFVNWHVHEMIFGFTMALLSGFLLTASVNWSGQKAKTGPWLFFLGLFWVLERFSLVTPLSNLFIILLNIPFLALFICMLIFQLKGNRNLKIMLPTIFILTSGKFLILFGDYTEKENLVFLGRDFSLGVIRYLLALMSCRLLPFFSSKIMPDAQIEGISSKLKIFFLSSLVLADTQKSCSNLVDLDPIFQNLLYLSALTSGLVILFKLRPHKTYNRPMLLILTIGFTWLLASMLGEILIHYSQHLKDASIHIHLLTAGALGCFGIGMMTRVALGHTGRPIQADKWTIAMFALINIGALGRVLTPILSHSFYMKWLHTIAGFWVGGFFLFLVIYSKKLFKARLDQKTL